MFSPRSTVDVRTELKRCIKQHRNGITLRACDGAQNCPHGSLENRQATDLMTMLSFYRASKELAMKRGIYLG